MEELADLFDTTQLTVLAVTERRQRRQLLLRPRQGSGVL